jgi:GT2 family glycosyltransferase
VAQLNRFGNRVRVVQTGENLGFGRGVNRGVDIATGTYVMALNPDVKLACDAVAKLVGYLEGHPRVGLVGPRLKDASGHVHASCGLAPRLGDEICRKFLLHLIFPLFKFRSQHPDKPVSVGWVTGACMAFRRDAIRAVGGFDDAIFMYYEDVDLCLRLKNMGWDVHYVPEAEGIHLGGESSKQALTRMLVVSESSYVYFIRKHMGRMAAITLVVLRPVEMILRSFLWGSLFLLVPHRRVEAVARLRAYWILLTRGVSV